MNRLPWLPFSGSAPSAQTQFRSGASQCVPFATQCSSETHPNLGRHDPDDSVHRWMYQCMRHSSADGSRNEPNTDTVYNFLRFFCKLDITSHARMYCATFPKTETAFRHRQNLSLQIKCADLRIPRRRRMRRRRSQRAARSRGVARSAAWRRGVPRPHTPPTPANLQQPRTKISSSRHEPNKTQARTFVKS